MPTSLVSAGGSASFTDQESSGEDSHSGPAQLSARDSSTGSANASVGRNGSSAIEPTNGHAQKSSVSTIPSEVNWSTLSERGQAILRQVGTRLSEGYTPGEIGHELGISRRLVLGLVDELRTELERIS
jgi:hypothetical protein